MEGHSFLRAFEIKRDISRDMSKCPVSISLSTGALVGNLEGISLLGLSETKG
jgi:hypothetical protein